MTLAREFHALGVRPGRTILVHASLRRVGSGAATVAASIGEILGEEGTLVVPTGTSDNSDTSRIHLERTAGMAPAERDRYRAAMPAFDPATTPSTGMGALAEHVRTAPGARRSAHPQTSFAALGPAAGRITGGHAAGCHLGEHSPLARLYETGADILLLGVGYESCTAFHLAEYRYTDVPPTRRYRCVIEQDGRPAWWSYQDVDLDDGDFSELGEALERSRPVRTGRVGAAEARLIPLRTAVDFAVDWLAVHRAASHKTTSG